MFENEKIEEQINNENNDGNATTSTLLKFEENQLNQQAKMINIDRTLNLSSNTKVSKLILENKIDFADKSIQIRSLNSFDQNLFETEDNKELHLKEINLGTIQSLPNLNINLSEKQLKELQENSDFNYNVSLVGRKVNEEEINSLYYSN